MTIQNLLLHKFHNYIIIIALVVYGITAYTSFGYYHGDEHYQIIEYAGAIEGTHTVGELPWEYKAQSRQTIQPIMFYGLSKSLDFIGVQNNYYQAFVLRLLSAFFAIFCISRFVNATYPTLDKSVQKGYILLSYFLWFTPVIAVRFSSETWGGLSLLLALSYLVKDIENKTKHLIWVGALLGFSFLFRYQMVFALFGLGLWLIFVKKYKFLPILKLVLGFVLVIIFGILLDSFFYGNFVLTIWEYFYKQLIEGMAAAFGTSPWYFYWQELFRAPTYFMGLLFILSMLVLIISKEGRKRVELWIVLPFLFGHNFVEHKEIRFLFPLIFLLPSVFVFAYSYVVKWFGLSWVKTLHVGLLVIFLLVNSVGIGLMMMKSAGNGNITNAKYLYDVSQTSDKKIDVYHLTWASPFHPWENITDKFYTPVSVSDIKIDNLCVLDTLVLNPEHANYVLLRQCDLENKDCDLIIGDWQCRKVSSSIPSWMEPIKEWYEHEKSNESVYYLYELSKD